MNVKTQGAIAMLLSAFLYGTTPIMGQLSYNGGSNSMMLTFLRAALSLPVLLVIVLAQRQSLRISKRNFRDIVLLSTFGSTASAVTYYMAFQYITVGLATVINGTYPFFVTIYSAIFWGERLSRASWLALVMAMVGIFMFIDPTTDKVNWLGLFYALISSITYAFVLLFQYRSSIGNMPSFKLSFWLSTVMGASMLIIALIAGQFTVNLTPVAWASSFGVAIGASVLALTLTQVGLVRIGSSAASILMMFQPITSVVMGVLILNESISLMKGMGGILILTAVTLITLSTNRQTKPASSEETLAQKE